MKLKRISLFVVMGICILIGSSILGCCGEKAQAQISNGSFKYVETNIIDNYKLTIVEDTRNPGSQYIITSRSDRPDSGIGLCKRE